MDNQNALPFPSLLTKVFGPLAAGIAALATFVLIIHASPANSQVSAMSSPPAAVVTTTADDALIFLTTLADRRATLRVEGWLSDKCSFVLSKTTHLPVMVCPAAIEDQALTLHTQWLGSEIKKIKLDGATIYSSNPPVANLAAMPAVWVQNLNLGDNALICTSDNTVAPAGCLEFRLGGLPMPKNP